MSEFAASVIIPAHNEEASVGRLLGDLSEAPTRAVEVIVVANGCTDRTTQIAREAPGRPKVLELAEGSKVAALNAGSDAAVSWPRIFIDADVRISMEVVVALAQVLSQGFLVASPEMIVDSSAASSCMRLYQKAWARSAYRRSGPIGAGVYGLSEEGGRRIGRFPDVTADDLLIDWTFSHSERAVLAAPMSFTVPSPKRVSSEVKRLRRTRRGEIQLRNLIDAGSITGLPVTTRSLLGLLKRATLILPLTPSGVVYAVVRAAGYSLASLDHAIGRRPTWYRDETNRLRTTEKR